jgi:hypothetical protein
MAANDSFEYDPQVFPYDDSSFPSCIFSYASSSNNGKGKSDMLALAQVLAKNGITSFNGYQVKAGQDWQEEWYGIMPECKIGIILLSPEYFQSKACVQECLELVKQKKIKLLPLQFGMPNTTGRFLGEEPSDIKAANMFKLKIKNVLPPPDQGSFDADWEGNARKLVRRIKEMLGLTTERRQVDLTIYVCVYM